MTPRAARRGAGAGLAVAVAAALLALVLGLGLDVDGFLDAWLLLMLAFFGFAVVGWVIATRRPSHPIGWLMLAFGGLPLVASLVQTYARVAVFERPGRLPAGAEMAWLGELPWGAVWSLLAVILLLFPTGLPASARWRWVVRLVAVNGLATVLLGAVTLWPARADFATVGYIGPPGGLGGAAMAATIALVGVGIVAGAGSLLVRYRSAGDVERTQLRWLAFTCPFIVLVVALVLVRNILDWGMPWLLNKLTVAPIIVVPVAIGIAILRYRLYEIDRVVSRAATYVIVTGLLAGTYACAALLLGRIVAPLDARSDLAVAGATLAAAALFTPARRAVQEAVDRRFNRARYDARREVEAFRTRLRDEVDLGEIHRTLLATVVQTVEPAGSSLWLRTAAERR